MPLHHILRFAGGPVIAKQLLTGRRVLEVSSRGKAGIRLAHSQRRFNQGHRFWDWLTNHPRAVIPVITGLLAAIAVVITNSTQETKTKGTNSEALFTNHHDVIKQIQKWLMESTDTFIIIKGQALCGQKGVLVIDCKPIIEARGENDTVKALASAVRYRPFFSWANRLSHFADVAIEINTGLKSVFSETLDSQLNKILRITTAALKQVSLSGRDKDFGDTDSSDDAFLEAHPEKRAVVVIDNFLLKIDETGIIYDKLSEWAAALVRANIAHVVFMTSDISYSKTLSKSLPDRVFRTITLRDLSPDAAKKFVMSRFHQPKLSKDRREAGDEKVEDYQPEHKQDLRELDDAIEVLGGHFIDLESLVRHMKTGKSPRQALQEIIDQSASEITKLYLRPNKGDRKYSTEQAWFLIKEIAKKESLRYNEFLLSNTFASSTSPGVENGEMALEALANAELITVRLRRGHPQTIQAGKPVYRAAFAELLHDSVLKARLDLAVLNELSKVEAETVDKIVNELSLLNSLPQQSREATERINYLFNKLQTSQSKIAGFEEDMAALKKVLGQEA